MITQESLFQLERYRPIVPDWKNFTEVLSTELPRCLWVNPLRTDPQQLQADLRKRGVEIESLSWHPSAFKVRKKTKLGSLPEYVAGHYHVQEEVSLIPPLLLDPQPGERVLDLCAAPGGKTAAMALAMQNQGTLVANDVDFKRNRAIQNTIERLGIINVNATAWGGHAYPRSAGVFDRILCDVPCSCQGTSRKSSSVLKPYEGKWLEKLWRIQEEILINAFLKCKPGGRIVYSTCTYAPEENEVIIDSVLKRYASQGLSLKTIDLPGFKFSPGLTHWNGEDLDPSISRCMRIWPHQNDSGGFFVAVLEKSWDAFAVDFSSDLRQQLPECRVGEKLDESHPLYQLLLDRFGIDRLLIETFRFVATGTRHLNLVPQDFRPGLQPPAEIVGLRAFNLKSAALKMSHGLSLLMGPHASKNRVLLEDHQIELYLQGEAFQVQPEQLRNAEAGAYVLIQCAKESQKIPTTLGGAWLKRGETGLSIQSLLPKTYLRPSSNE